MTLEELNKLFEDVKNGFGVFKDFTITSHIVESSVKHDRYGEIREMTIKTFVFFKKPRVRAEIYNLVIKPKKNEITIIDSYGAILKFPKEALDFIVDKYCLTNKEIEM